MSKKVIHLLCAEADRAALQPVLDALKAKGLRVSESRDSSKEDIVLAALSGSFYADSAGTETLLDLVAAGAETVLPLQLDGAPIPDTIKNALYARNIIPAAGRDAAHTAERIVAALPKRKTKLPLILSAAALVLFAAVGFLLWRANQSPPEETVPVMAATAEPVDEIAIPAGLTAEDLAAIEDVIIVGDYFGYYTDADFRQAGEHWLNVYDDVAYRAFEDNMPVWISKEDGHAYAMTRYDDLRFLELMPKLRFLELVNVEAAADRLPQLGEAAILEGVHLSDCNIDSLDWLTGAKMHAFDIHNTQVTDYTPLTSCSRLKDVNLDLYLMEEADCSGFAPPELQSFRISSGQDLRGGLDLSALSACTKLRECQLDADLPLADLSFLAEATKLEALYISEQHELRDISALNGMKNLKHLEIQYCERVTDYTPIAGCSSLEQIHFQCDYNPDALRDASFLAELPKLRDIGLYGCNLNDMDFLEGIAAHQSRINLGFAGDILDYSGLVHIKNYDYLHVNPRYHYGNRGGEFSAVLPYIQNAEIDYLMLYDCAGVDLSQLPDGIRQLSIVEGDLRDLRGLKPYSLRRLELRDCQYLSSLNGIEAIPTMFGSRGQMELEIRGCLRLADYAALSGSNLIHLKLVGQYVLPDLGSLHTRSLRLESIPELQDLHLLDALSTDEKIGIDLVGLDELRDLSPLHRLNGGHLIVPPQVAEQAEELVDEGIFDSFEVAYPDGSWQPFDGAVELLSLDELDTLPPPLLRRVKRLCIAGDALVDPDRYDIWEDWEHRDENGNPTLQLHDRETDAVTPLSPGVIADFSSLSALTGLRELYLYSQPIRNLDGIQVFSSLEQFSAKGCSALTDASALFALPELRWVDLKCTQVDSIQGVQNLRELRYLDVSDTRVSDLTPLAECDFSAAEKDVGFDLDCNELNLGEEDFIAMAHIRRFRGLAFTNADPAVWIGALSGCEIHYFGAAGDLHSNEDLAAFAADHPELRALFLGWEEDITDLTPLLALEDLERVSVNQNMREAIASLDGQNFAFELEIQG